ncbi:hemerythrin domain-containing protein, partial [Streptomyces cinereoruber]
MKELEGCDGDHPRLDELVMKLMTQIRSHVNDEENNLFPYLRQARFAETLEKLGDKVRQAEKTAPTRPHPSVPDKPPANKLPGPGVGLV